MNWTLVVTAVISMIFVVIALNFVTGEKRVASVPKRLYPLTDPQFKRVMGSLFGPPILGGNRIDTLINGDEIFPGMLAAIRGARKNINFETYVYWSGQIGREFADAIAERARAGVECNVLLDWAGTQKMDASVLSTLRNAGVHVELYHPLAWYTLARLNNRTHRKLLIVDGTVAFTGGVGIAEEWTGDAQDPDHWRDTHFRVEGPVVAQMQASFLDNWMKVTGKALHGGAYFPSLEMAGNVEAQMFLSSPTGGGESMELMYLLAIVAASESIKLEAAYFIPDEIALHALIEARARGVHVEVIVPGKYSDSGLTRQASRGTWGPLLKAGVKIHEYQPTMFHCKVLIIDGVLTSVGSTNFDPRSFRLNDEASLNAYDTSFADAQSRIFEQDKAKSVEFTLQMWEERSFMDRAREWVSSLLQSQL
ncbi:MAG: phospholipase D-like domain-containing protein [Dokdonella sp.]